MLPSFHLATAKKILLNEIKCYNLQAINYTNLHSKCCYMHVFLYLISSMLESISSVSRISNMSYVNSITDYEIRVIFSKFSAKKSSILSKVKPFLWIDGKLLHNAVIILVAMNLKSHKRHIIF
jgi:hypothetical protein